MSSQSSYLNSLPYIKRAGAKPSHGLLQKFFTDYFPFLFSLIYAFTLCNLPLDVFKDREYYLIYASNSDLILNRFYSRGLLTIFSNEPLWLLINSILSIILDSNNVVRLIIFSSSFSISYYFIKMDRRNAVWLCLFLLSPQVIKNHIIHLRQGLALAFFLIGYNMKSKFFKNLFFLLSPLIHSSFFFVLFILMISNISKIFEREIVIRTIFTLLSFFTLIIFSEFISNYFGARQLVNLYETDISGLGFLYWSSIAAIMISSGHRYLMTNYFSLSAVLFYLSAYFILPVSGRIFESCLIFVLISCVKLIGWRKYVFISSFIAYSGITYIIRIGQPWLGWGV